MVANLKNFNDRFIVSKGKWSEPNQKYWALTNIEDTILNTFLVLQFSLAKELWNRIGRKTEMKWNARNSNNEMTRNDGIDDKILDFIDKIIYNSIIYNF